MSDNSRLLDVDTRHRLEQIFEIIGRMSRVLEAALTAARLQPIIPNRESRVVVHLARFGAQRPRDLQELSGLTSGGLTKLLDRLEDAGMVSRDEEGDHRDGRSILVRITPAGRRAVRTFDRVISDTHDDVRPMAKEIVQLCESLGVVRRADEPPGNDLTACMARVGLRLQDAILQSSDDPTFDYATFQALCMSEYHDGCRPNYLIEVLRLSSGGVTKLLQRAEAGGWLVREVGALDDDHRAVVVRPTDAGRRQLDLTLLKVLGHVDELLDVMHWIAERVRPVA